MVESNIENNVSVEAAVNAGTQVILYDAGGRSMAVSPEDVNHWMSQGLLRTPYDPGEMIIELKVLGPSVIDAFIKLIETVGEDGVIDTNEAAALATASMAQQHFNSICSRVLRGIEARYPIMSTGETASMFDADGNPTVVAVEQRDMYIEEHGFTDREDG